MNDRAAFEAWIAENWPNLAAPWWLSSEDAIQQLAAFSAGAKYGAIRAEAALKAIAMTPPGRSRLASPQSADDQTHER
jgi:hypothetical protein